MRRKKGAQPRNRNALKHGFYSKCLSQSDSLQLQEAASVEGVDGEIALVRLKIGHLMERDPDNVALMVQAASTLTRLMRVKNMGPQQGNPLNRATGNVLREVALILGQNIDGKSTG